MQQKNCYTLGQKCTFYPKIHIFIGIADPVGYAKRRLADEEDVTYLATCCVGKTITDGLEANVEEAVYANGSFVDVMPFLPSVLSDEDTALLINTFVVDGKKSGGSSGGGNKKRVSSSSAGKTPVVLAETVVTCQAFIDRLVEVNRGFFRHFLAM